MKTLITCFVCLLFALAAFGQSPTPEPSATPQFAITVGGGFSQYTDPSRTLSGGFKVRLTDGAYSATYVDQGMKFNPEAGKREPISTLRTGVEKRLLQQGPIGLWGGGDLGGVAGAGNLTGVAGLNGTITYDLPQRLKMSGCFAYAGARLLKAPQPAVSDPALVQTAFSFGLGWHSAN